MTPFNSLCSLKLTILKNALLRLKKQSPLEAVTLVFFLILAGAGLFVFFFYSLRFFKNQEPFGPLLIAETFYLLNFTLFIMLLISSAVSAYSSLYTSGEVPFLVTKPVPWSDLYNIKLIETFWYSSWSTLFLIIPFMAAYGLNRQVSPFLFILFSFCFYIPFVTLTCLLGSLLAVFCVALFPGRTQRRTLIIFIIAGLSIWLHHHQPELIKEQGSLAGIMMGYLPHVAFAKNIFLPSYWVSQGILAAASYGNKLPFSPHEGIFYFLVLLSNALFLWIPTLWAGEKIYPKSYLRLQDHSEGTAADRIFVGKLSEKIFDLLPRTLQRIGALLEKDLKNFSRNPSEWSQLIIFFGLLLFYFSNLRNLQFHILKDFWKQLVFALNTLGTYIVLSSFSMRVIFPMLSMEGNKSWVLGSVPLQFSILIFEKFLLGLLMSCSLTLPLIGLSGWMLGISHGQILFILVLGFFVCLALTGLSAGLGAKFIDFKSNNPTAIISGVGGSLLLITHLSYLTLIGVYLAFSGKLPPAFFYATLLGSFAVGFLPLWMGVRSMQRLEF